MNRDPKTTFADIDTLDPDRFVAHLTEDVVFRFGNGDPLVGRNAVRDAVAGFFTSITGMRHDLLALHEDGDVVVVRADVSYTRQDGGVVVIPNADILTYQGSLVRDWQIYIDLAPVYA